MTWTLALFTLPLVGRVDRWSLATAVAVGDRTSITKTSTPRAALATLPTKGRVKKEATP
jgi:hypothetical protein